MPGKIRDRHACARREGTVTITEQQAHRLFKGVGHGQIQFVIAIKIADRDGVWAVACFVTDSWAKSTISFPHQYLYVIARRVSISDDEIQFPVSIQIFGHDEVWRQTCGVVYCGLEGS